MLPKSGRVPDVAIMRGERCTGISVLYQIVTICTPLSIVVSVIDNAILALVCWGCWRAEIHQFVRFALITLVAH